MSLQDDIMNIPVPEYHDDGYYQGHLDARQSAALLAAAYEANQSDKKVQRTTLDLTDLTGDDAQRVQDFVSGLSKKAEPHSQEHG